MIFAKYLIVIKKVGTPNEPLPTALLVFSINLSLQACDVTMLMIASTSNPFSDKRLLEPLHQKYFYHFPA